MRLRGWVLDFSRVLWHKVDRAARLSGGSPRFLAEAARFALGEPDFGRAGRSNVDRSACARLTACVTLIALVLGTILTADSMPDPATSESPLLGAGVSVVAFTCGHVLADLVVHPREQWQLPVEGTTAAFAATTLCGAAVDPVLAIPLGVLAGALFWPTRGRA